MDSSELQRLLANGERTHVEFKSKRIGAAWSDKHKDTIAAEIASLANRGGGYLIFGIDDKTGKIEAGKLPDAKAITENVANLNRDLLSPPTELSHGIVQTSQGEALWFRVSKRREVPHALVHRRGTEIRERTYYLRNAHGRQLLTDTELLQLFRNENFPSIVAACNHVFLYERSLQRPFRVRELPPPGTADEFLGHVVSEWGPSLEDESTVIPELIRETFPYCVLAVLGRGFSAGWAQRITSTPGTITVGRTNDDYISVEATDIPLPAEGAIVLHGISDFREFIDQHVLSFHDLLLPPGCEVHISDGGRYDVSRLAIGLPGVFDFVVDYRQASWGLGFPNGHPRLSVVREPHPGPDTPLAWTSGTVQVRFELKFGESPYRDRADFFEWGKRLVDLVERQLSWQLYVNSLPDPLLLRVDTNVRRLLERAGGEPLNSERINDWDPQPQP